MKKVSNKTEIKYLKRLHKKLCKEFEYSKNIKEQGEYYLFRIVNIEDRIKELNNSNIKQ